MQNFREFYGGIRPPRLVMILVIVGVYQNISFVGTVGVQDIDDICYHDFESDYHLTKNLEFRAFKFLCNTNKNLRCNQVTKDPNSAEWIRIWQEGMDIFGNESSDPTQIQSQVWTYTTTTPTYCGCEDEDQLTYIKFRQKGYLNKMINETRKIGLDVYDVLNQNSAFESKCLATLGQACNSTSDFHRIRPPNAICRLSSSPVFHQSSFQGIWECEDGYFPILNACYRDNSNVPSKNAVVLSSSSGTRDLRVKSDLPERGRRMSENGTAVFLPVTGSSSPGFVTSKNVGNYFKEWMAFVVTLNVIFNCVF